jgi:hypothetical protein
MKRFWRAACAAGLVVVATDSAVVRGQLPGGAGGLGAPVGAPATPVGVVPGAAPPPAAAMVARPGFFQRVCAGLDECRRKICRTPAGQLLNGVTKPVSAFTGGVIPGFCPIMPSAMDLMKPGVSGAAAQAQKDALEAKARRDAVRFLGTLDCRYYPDAAVNLAAALRTDGSECVRFEAAMVLGRGCCCTEVTIKALEATVSGSEIDGNPAERSVRVRCAAAVALEKCLSCYTPPPVEVEVPKKDIEVPPGELKPDVLPAPAPLPGAAAQRKDDAAKLPVANRLPKRETVERARKTLLEFNVMLADAQPTMARVPGTAAGRQSVYHLLKDTAVGGPSADMVPPQLVVTFPTPTQAPQSYAAPTPPPAAPTAPPPVAARPAAPVSFRPAPTTAPVAAPMPTPMPAAAPPVAAAPRMPAAPVATFSPPMPTTAPMTAAPAAAVMPTAPVVTAPVSDPVAIVPPDQVLRFAPAPTEPTEVVPAVREPGVIPAGVTAAEQPVVGTWTPDMQPGATAAPVLHTPTTNEQLAAIRELARNDWRQNPVVASTLLAAAKSDPSRLVRVECIKQLAAGRMNHPQVMTELAVLANDADPLVRYEVAQALDLLKRNP